jgi:hypothetical protein
VRKPANSIAAGLFAGDTGHLAVPLAAIVLTAVSAVVM